MTAAAKHHELVALIAEDIVSTYCGGGEEVLQWIGWADYQIEFESARKTALDSSLFTV